MMKMKNNEQPVKRPACYVEEYDEQLGEVIIKFYPDRGKPSRTRQSSGAYWRNEFAIEEGRRSFTPDVTMHKGEPNLGPIANSVVQDTI